MIALCAVAAGCADTHTRPAALHGRWHRTVVYPQVTLHTWLYLAPNGTLSHSIEAQTVAHGDTLSFRADIRGRWYLQRSLTEFYLLQAEYAPSTIRRQLSVNNADSDTSCLAVQEGGIAILRALPPTWDGMDNYLLAPHHERPTDAALTSPFTLLELTDTTTTTLTGFGCYTHTIRLTRLKEGR